MEIHALAATTEWERRVALTPDGVRQLVGKGHRVSIDAGAGSRSGFCDRDYTEAGATVGDGSGADLMVCVERPDPARIAGASAVLGLLDPLDPLGSPDALASLVATGTTLLAFELVPRTTRAQTVDVLSSQAALAGYQAALEAAVRCDRIFPMLTTAAGTLRPANVLVLGAGVAGLQAIATARRLGAVVSGFDVRAAAAEQVESLGATFVSVDIEPQDAAAAGGYAQELADETERRLLEGLFEPVTSADAVITTAAIPGRPAPRLVTAEMVSEMRAGSVVIDTSGATGGNCEVSRPGETVVLDGVGVSAPLDLPSRSANHASRLFSRNVVNYVELITGSEGGLDLGVDDEIVRLSTVAADGEITHDRIRSMSTERN
ncbi:MAG TPA: NAD(P) transhydrogenase subunit alpha [Acidimicrobiia bacterium]|nr:NAD(P) transhydrogenase subunit alpha [Acidimicrobiia bacterium]